MKDDKVAAKVVRTLSHGSQGLRGLSPQDAVLAVEHQGDPAEGDVFFELEGRWRSVRSHRHVDVDVDLELDRVREVVFSSFAGQDAGRRCDTNASLPPEHDCDGHGHDDALDALESLGELDPVHLGQDALDPSVHKLVVRVQVMLRHPVGVGGSPGREVSLGRCNMLLLLLLLQVAICAYFSRRYHLHILNVK